jgi:hypothetical protein
MGRVCQVGRVGRGAWPVSWMWFRVGVAAGRRGRFRLAWWCGATIALCPAWRGGPSSSERSSVRTRRLCLSVQICRAEDVKYEPPSGRGRVDVLLQRHKTRRRTRPASTPFRSDDSATDRGGPSARRRACHVLAGDRVAAPAAALAQGTASRFRRHRRDRTSWLAGGGAIGTSMPADRRGDPGRRTVLRGAS